MKPWKVLSVLFQLNKLNFNKRNRLKEAAISNILLLCASVTVLTTFGILIVLSAESFRFFTQVSLGDFFSDTRWTPLFAEKHFGILPLLSGTLLVTMIALIVALPLGLIIAVYLSEYASKRFRMTVKPLLEILAAVPTVVYGFFALVFVTPALQHVFPGMSGFNALSPGIVMGIMIIPFITSMSEDALSSVPGSLREAAYGMGSTRLQTSFLVLLPAASSGIMASVILAVSRALGETMIVTIAAGQMPGIHFNPVQPVQTITAYIVQVSAGDVPYGSIEHKTIFAAGLALFVLTFILNNISFYISRKYRQRYD